MRATSAYSLLMLRRECGADDASELEGDGAKARRAVRANNFTQQTNTLDVDKHMHVYKFFVQLRLS